MNTPSHESPILVLLPPRRGLAEALGLFLRDADVRQVHFPPLWCLDGAGVDLVAALPDVRSVDLESLPTVVEAMLRLCNEEALTQLVTRMWRSVDERVRDYYLQRSVLETFGAIFRVRRQAIEHDPPPSFRRDRIFEQAVTFTYRIARADDEDWDARAPGEEGSLVFHPFDPTGREARLEAELEPEGGAVLEVFAYGFARERHLVLAQRLALAHGWAIHDTAESAET